MSHLLDRRPGKGTEVYLRHLAKEFLKDPEIDLTLIHFEKIPEEFLYQEAREIIMKPFGGFRFLAELYFFLTTKERFDIIHWFVPRLYPFYWLAPAKKIVVTSHGAADKIAPNFKTFALRIFNFIFTYFHFWVDAVIGVSESGRKEIIEAYHFDPQRVYAIYNGVSEAFHPIDKKKALATLKERYDILDPPFILYAGRLEPRKNVKRIVEAYDLFRQTSGRKEKLVIVGGPGSASQEVKQRAAASPFFKDIQFIGVVYFEDMPSLYSLAEVFIFPSVSESFGLPVIEAMACGTPVITSNITSLPEISGDAALKVDPYNTEEMSKALSVMLGSADVRNKYIKMGFENIKRFSWSKMSQEIKSLYKKLLYDN